VILSALNRNARLLVLLLRHRVGQRSRRAVTDGERGQAAKPDALVQALRSLVSRLAAEGDGRFEIGRPGELRLTADERSLLTVVAVACVADGLRPAGALSPGMPTRLLTRADLVAAVQRAVMLVGQRPSLPGPALRLARVRGKKVDHVRVAWP